MRALELFCGIGGFSAAVAGSNVQVIAAVDQNASALQVYRRNFAEHETRQVDLERVSAWELTSCSADIWWMSPPCQPYCERGTRRDLDDPRARSLLRLLELFSSIPDGRLPESIALENVFGFSGSQARNTLVPLLERRGYQVHERLLCPTDLGVPSRRPRYYLIASRRPFNPPQKPGDRCTKVLREYLDEQPEPLSPSLLVAPDVVERFGSGLRILNPDDSTAYTTCFTSGYGKSIVNAGSYLRHGDAVRYFSPEEIARLLHFPDWFTFPPEMPIRKRWHLVGNSLSIIAVREVLQELHGVSP